MHTEAAPSSPTPGKLPRKEFGKVRVIKGEELKQIQEEAKRLGFMPRAAAEARPTESADARAKRERVTSFLSGQLRELRLDLQGAEGRLMQMRRNPVADRLMPGLQTRAQSTMEDVSRMENQALGYRAHIEALTHALQAFESGQPLPADAREELSAIEERLAKQLSDAFEEQQRHPEKPMDLTHAKHQLALARKVIEDLG